MKLPHALKERPPRCRFTLCQLVTSNESHQNSSLNGAEAPGPGSPPRPAEPTPATAGTLAENPGPRHFSQMGRKCQEQQFKKIIFLILFGKLEKLAPCLAPGSRKRRTFKQLETNQPHPKPDNNNFCSSAEVEEAAPGSRQGHREAGRSLSFPGPQGQCRPKDSSPLRISEQRQPSPAPPRTNLHCNPGFILSPLPFFICPVFQPAVPEGQMERS
ncbi:uncharacterized protein LOC119699465 [Motacilla alba alba]|uniref:uncharacterized protein LOC119699465 n=1 Tax=Motacilla alba alba TaxID=1094192 RepID=UPI0018D5A1E2|nr:uncharacterized protein LOC119699465 [Motacilla alba alba]